MYYPHSRLKAFTKNYTLPDGRKISAEEAAHRSGMWLAASVYGNEPAQRWCRDHGIQFRVMSGSTLTGGGALVPSEMEQAIIDLRDQYGVARRIAKVRTMGSDQIQVPRRTGGLDAHFFADDDGTGLTASDKSWDQVTLSAKKLGILSRVSSDLLEDSILNVVDDLAQEMGYAFAVKEDQCFLLGDGTSTYGGMQGLITKFESTAYASRIALDANMDTFAEIDAANLAKIMAGPASFGKPGAIFLCSQTAKSLVFDRLKAAAGGNAISDLGGDAGDRYLGYRIETSEAMPAGATTDYTSKVMLLFGRFDLSTSFGSRRGIGIQVLRERYAELGQIGIVGTERFDIVNHDLGSTSAKGPIAAAYGG